MVSFLNVASLPTYLYLNYGTTRLFSRRTLPKAVGSGFPPAIHRALGSCNVAPPPLHTPHSQLSSRPTQGGEVSEETTLGNKLESRNRWYLLVEICTLIGLCACQSPVVPQRSRTPILSCKPEMGTEWASNQASETGSRGRSLKPPEGN